MILVHVNDGADDDSIDLDEFADVKNNLFRFIGSRSTMSYRLHCNFEPTVQSYDVFAMIIQSADEEVIHGSQLPRH